jgi:carotenoid cleavage dioxygenase-like enzyme
LIRLEPRARVVATHPGLRSVEREVRDRELEVRGRVPEWLSGTLVRNGPGLFEAGDDRVSHWFDGLALLRRYAFDEGTIRYGARLLRTEAYADATAGRLTGGFGTDTRGWRRVLELLRSGLPEPTDNANVHVARLGGEHVALTEAPRRVAFDPETLETRGEFSFDDDLPEHLAAAHLVADPHRGETVGFVTQFGPRPRYHVYRVARGSRRRERVATIRARGRRPAYVHDCSVTADHVVLVEPPLVVSPLRALSPLSEGLADALDWRPERGTRLLVIDRDTGELVADPTTPAAFAFHHVGAYVDDGTVVVDLVEYPDADVLDAMRMDRLDDRAAAADASGSGSGSGGDGDGGGADVGPGTGDAVDAYPTRYRIDLDRNAASRSRLADRGTELPRVARSDVGRRHRFAYGQATDRQGANGLLKLDCRTGAVDEWWEPSTYVEEPIPVRPPGGAGDDGVVVAPALDADRERSELLLLDAGTLDVRARAALPCREPFGFHGRFFRRIGPDA